LRDNAKAITYRREIITQKKLPISLGAPRAVLLLFLNRGPPGGSGFALGPNAGGGANGTVKNVGSATVRTSPIMPAKSPPTASRTGAKPTPATGAGPVSSRLRTM